MVVIVELLFHSGPFRAALSKAKPHQTSSTSANLSKSDSIEFSLLFALNEIFTLREQDRLLTTAQIISCTEFTYLMYALANKTSSTTIPSGPNTFQSIFQLLLRNLCMMEPLFLPLFQEEKEFHYYSFSYSSSNQTSSFLDRLKSSSSPALSQSYSPLLLIFRLESPSENILTKYPNSSIQMSSELEISSESLADKGAKYCLYGIVLVGKSSLVCYLQVASSTSVPNSKASTWLKLDMTNLVLESIVLNAEAESGLSSLLLFTAEKKKNVEVLFIYQRLDVPFLSSSSTSSIALRKVTITFSVVKGKGLN